MVTFQGFYSFAFVTCHWSQVEAERMGLMKAKQSDIGNELILLQSPHDNYRCFMGRRILLQSHHDNYRCFYRLHVNRWFIWTIYGNLRLVCFCIDLIKILNAHTTWRENGWLQRLFYGFPFDLYFSNRYSDHHLNTFNLELKWLRDSIFKVSWYATSWITKVFFHLFSTLPGFFGWKIESLRFWSPAS